MTCLLVTVCLAPPVTLQPPDNLETHNRSLTLLPQGDTPINPAGEGEVMLTDHGETIG